MKTKPVRKTWKVQKKKVRRKKKRRKALVNLRGNKPSTKAYEEAKENTPANVFTLRIDDGRGGGVKRKNVN